MKHNIIKSALMAVVILSTSSCATLYTKSKKDVMFKGIPQTAIYDAKAGTKLGEIESNGFTTIKLRKKLGGLKVNASLDGYQSRTVKVGSKISGASFINLLNPIFWGIDIATGKITTYTKDVVDITLLPDKSGRSSSASTSVSSESDKGQRVSRDNAGRTDMERAIIRWTIDSDPQGARIFWRVISSIPDEVKNTNETYLTTTPYEETRSFNILGLTYENSRDVTIEIKITKKGYSPQVKRFNVRQALDQQEISTFFELVKED